MRVIEGRKGSYWFRCPGCNDNHCIYTTEAKQNIAWDFNGNVEIPTFSPSLKCSWGPPENPSKHICHSFIREGKIEFCSDSTHKFAGSTMDLPEINANRDFSWVINERNETL